MQTNSIDEPMLFERIQLLSKCPMPILEVATLSCQRRLNAVARCHRSLAPPVSCPFLSGPGYSSMVA